MLEERLLADQPLRYALQVLVVSVLDIPIHPLRHTTHYVEFSWSLRGAVTTSGFPEALLLDAARFAPIEEAHGSLILEKQRSDRLQINNLFIAHVASGSPHGTITTTADVLPRVLEAMTKVRIILH